MWIPTVNSSLLTQLNGDYFTAYILNWLKKEEKSICTITLLKVQVYAQKGLG